VLTADAGRTEGARAALAGAQLAKQLKARMPVLTGVAAVLAGKAEVREVATLIGDSVATEE
jgi:glycerol-3-phosphate dehydrogenase